MTEAMEPDGGRPAAADARADVRSLASELERTRRRNEALLRERGALEERIESQAAELDRRRSQLDDTQAELDASRWSGGGYGHWSDPAPSPRGLWDSPAAISELYRRITGSATRHPDAHFHDRHQPDGPAATALVVGPASAATARRLLSLPVAARLTWLDPMAERAQAVARSSDAVASATSFVAGQLDGWQAPTTSDLVVVRGALSAVNDVDAWAADVARAVGPGGLVYLDDFVGPTGNRWPAGQIELVQRLADRLSPALRRDLESDDGRLRSTFASGVTAEGGRADAIIAALGRRFEPVELIPYGGGVALPFFHRIMGNLAGQDDLVRIVMELDAVLTEHGAVESAYLWGVWRAP